MKSILLTSSAVLLAWGLTSAQAQDATCPAAIDSFTRDYEQAMGAAGGESLSASEQAQLFGLRTTAENLYRSGDLEMCAEAIQRARLMLETAIAPTAIRPGQLVGMDVRNAADEKLGEVEDVALDPVSGRIAYVVIEHGGFLGIGEDLTPLPWRAVTWAPGAEHVLVDLNEDRLENAPRYLEDEVTAQERRAWLLSVHNYHGVEPYWQDSMAGMAIAGGAQEPGAGMTAQQGTAPGAEVTTGLVTPVEGEGGTAESQPTAPPAAGTSGTAAPTETGTAATEPPAAGTAEEVRAFGEPAEGETDATRLEGEQATTAAEPATAEMTVEPMAGAAPDEGAMAALMQRIEDLEGRIEDLSERGLGDDVRQAIDQLESQVQELAQQAPGEEVRQAVADLREQVRQLAEQGPGQEVEQAIEGLEARVRELAETTPGRELREMMARMESEIRQLTDRGAGTAGGGAIGGTEVVPLDDAGQGMQPVAPATELESGVQGTAGIGEPPAVEQPAAQPGTVTVITSGGSDEQPGTQQPGTQQPGTQQSSTQQSGTQQSGTQQPGTQQAGGGTSDPAGMRAVGSDQTQPRDDAPAVTGGTLPRQTVPSAESDLGNPSAGGAGQATLTGEAGQSEPCETGITRLEEDLQRAEELGVSTDEARTELEAAQAMLRRASEALCRAAIKRARDELVAQGFEPTQAN